MYEYTSIHIHVYVFMFIYMHICMYVCMIVCIFICEYKQWFSSESVNIRCVSVGTSFICLKDVVKDIVILGVLSERRAYY